MKTDTSTIETILCGGTAGLVSRFFIAPLDVLKIRLQLQSSTRLYRGISHGFRTIIREEGIRSLWKGNAAAEILYVTYSASQFLTYKELTHLLTNAQLSPSLVAFVAGAGAGAVATTATYPFDLLRTRFAVQGNERRVYFTIASAVTQVWRQEGVRGMYRGLGASLVQIVPYMGLLFGTYEPTRAVLQGTGLVGEKSGWDAALAGFLAGSASKTGVFPLDVIRKRLQVQGPSRGAYVLNDIPIYNSALSCAVKIWQREGVRGFYKGLLVSLLKSAPSSAITLWTYEQSSRVLRMAKDEYARRAE